MIDITLRLEAATLDKDNFPRMDSERQVPVGLAKEAKAEIVRLRRWIFATSESLERSGLTVEEYNATTRDVRAAFTRNQS